MINVLKKIISHSQKTGKRATEKYENSRNEQSKGWAYIKRKQISWQKKMEGLSQIKRKVKFDFKRYS